MINSFGPLAPNPATSLGFANATSYTLKPAGGNVKTPEQLRHDAELAENHMFRLIACDPGYTYFGTQKLRDDLVDMSLGLTEYIDDNDIAAIVLMDRSARLARIGIKAVWDETYAKQDVPMPPVFFVNPRGFRPNNTDILDEKMRLVGTSKHGDAVDSTENRRTKESIHSEFKTRYSGLLKYSAEPVLLFDSCAHSGDQAKHVLETMTDVGFSDVHFGLGSVTLLQEPVCREPDFILSGREPAGACWPFGKDRATQKRYSSVVPSVSEDSSVFRDQTNAVRREIYKVVSERLAK